MGPQILVTSYNEIGFGRNEFTNGMGGGMGGGMMGGGMGGQNLATRNPMIERGLELLVQCSKLPLPQRPAKALEQLETMIQELVDNAPVPDQSTEILWSSVVTYENQFLVYPTTGSVHKLTERETAIGLLRWIEQLRFGDMESPYSVTQNFWYGLQHPTERDLWDWVVESQRDQTKTDHLLKVLPKALDRYDPLLDRSESTNDRYVQRGALHQSPGLGTVTDSIEFTLKLERVGWRIEKVKYGDKLIEF